MNHVFVVLEKNIKDVVVLYNKATRANKVISPMATIGIKNFFN